MPGQSGPNHLPTLTPEPDGDTDDVDDEEDVDVSQLPDTGAGAPLQDGSAIAPLFAMLAVMVLAMARATHRRRRQA